MTIYTDLFPAAATLVKRKFFKNPGPFSFIVPAGANIVRAHAIGAGGQGDNWGGGAARARTKTVVVPGTTLTLQVGTNSTGSTPGDSWVRRPDNSIIVYADRGRGNTARGLAANSQGDVTADGFPGVGGQAGASASDAADFGNLGLGGAAINSSLVRASDYGAGGYNYPWYDDLSVFGGYLAYGAGTGLVALEFFTSDPKF